MQVAPFPCVSVHPFYIQQVSPLVDPFLARLSAKEQADFNMLRSYFQLTDERNKRNMGLTTFERHLSMIETFVASGQAGDVDRAIAAGIHFSRDCILVNTQRLKSLMKRSKSCLNGCLHRLGFAVSRSDAESIEAYREIALRIGKQYMQPRQWCVRKKAPPVPTIQFPSLVPKPATIDEGNFIRSLLN